MPDGTNYQKWRNSNQSRKPIIINNNYPERILKILREYNDLPTSEISHDAEFQAMSHNEVFSKCLEWEGILGYDITLIAWVQDIYKVELK